MRAGSVIELLIVVGLVAGCAESNAEEPISGEASEITAASRRLTGTYLRPDARPGELTRLVLAKDGSFVRDKVVRCRAAGATCAPRTERGNVEVKTLSETLTDCEYLDPDDPLHCTVTHSIVKRVALVFKGPSGADLGSYAFDLKAGVLEMGLFKSIDTWQMVDSRRPISTAAGWKPEAKKFFEEAGGGDYAGWERPEETQLAAPIRARLAQARADWGASATLLWRASVFGRDVISVANDVGAHEAILFDSAGSVIGSGRDVADRWVWDR